MFVLLGLKRRKELGSQGDPPPPLPKPSSDVQSMAASERVSSTWRHQEQLGRPTLMHLLPWVFFCWPVTLWEVHCIPADSNKFQHLQPAGH